MSLQLTITASDTSDLKRKLRDLLSEFGESHTAPQGRAPAVAKQAEIQPSSPSQKPSATSTTATTAEPDGGATSASPSDEEPTAEEKAAWDYATEIKPRVLDVSKKHGREGVIKLLEKFGVGNASEIPAERHGELMAEINRLLED
jgi:uncharacterized membrane protein